LQSANRAPQTFYFRLPRKLSKGGHIPGVQE
jgi:hypothetical protein